MARKATKAEFHKMAPQVTDPGGKARTWVTRGGNFAVVVCEVEPGAVLERASDPEEHMIIVPPNGPTLSITAGGKTIEAKADSLTIVPPGGSKITAQAKGVFARIFSKASLDIMALASNAAIYADGAPELAPPDLWPAPHDGYKLRHYPLAQYAKPNGDRIQPRVFRSTNMLVNLFVHYQTRRDTRELSPHWHDDFEQASLTLNGKWVHHMRYTWGPDLGALDSGRPRRDVDAVGHHHPGDRGAHQPRRRRRRSLRSTTSSARRASTSRARRASSSTRPNIRCPTCRSTTR